MSHAAEPHLGLFFSLQVGVVVMRTDCALWYKAFPTLSIFHNWWTSNGLAFHTPQGDYFTRPGPVVCQSHSSGPQRLNHSRGLWSLKGFSNCLSEQNHWICSWSGTMHWRPACPCQAQSQYSSSMAEHGSRTCHKTENSISLTHEWPSQPQTTDMFNRSTDSKMKASPWYVDQIANYPSADKGWLWWTG